MQNNTIALSSLVGVLGLGSLDPASAGIVIGAFCGSIIFMLRAKKLSRLERIICTPIAFLMGVVGHDLLSQFDLMPSPVAAAIVAAAAVLVLVVLMGAVETDGFQKWVLSHLRGKK